MSDHRSTWRLWLEKISPFVRHREHCEDVVNDGGECLCEVPSESRLEAMAEALALASPQGPFGFECVDEDCDEIHEDVRNSKLTSRIKDLEAALKKLLEVRPQNEWIEDDERATIRTVRAILNHK